MELRNLRNPNCKFVVTAVDDRERSVGRDVVITVPVAIEWNARRRSAVCRGVRCTIALSAAGELVVRAPRDSVVRSQGRSWTVSNSREQRFELDAAALLEGVDLTRIEGDVDFPGPADTTLSFVGGPNDVAVDVRLPAGRVSGMVDTVLRAGSGHARRATSEQTGMVILWPRERAELIGGARHVADLRYVAKVERRFRTRRKCGPYVPRSIAGAGRSGAGAYYGRAAIDLRVTIIDRLRSRKVGFKSFRGATPRCPQTLPSAGPAGNRDVIGRTDRKGARRWAAERLARLKRRP